MPNITKNTMRNVIQNSHDHLHPAAQQGFSQAAELYQLVRPSYPPEIVDWLKHDLNISSNSVALDLGAGTGKFLDYLCQTTSKVIAVEPIAEMLNQLKIVHPEVQTQQAFSDAIALNSNSIDAIVCAQSFHWFAHIQSLKEMQRLLKPKGHLGLVWNQRDERVTWVKALADLLAQYEGDTPRFHSGLWQHVFQAQSLFQQISEKTFTQQHVGTVEQVVSKRLLSTSFIAAMPQTQQQEMKRQFEQIVHQHTGLNAQDQIAFPYVTYAFHYQAKD